MSEQTPAEKRADYVRALEFELEGYERFGKSDRAAQVRAELARVTGKPTERSTKPRETAAPTDDAPKSRRSRKSAEG